MTARSTRKGRLVEKVVALIHVAPGVKVERNVRLPTVDGKGTREIDVLLSGSIAGYLVRLAIECKNLQKKVGAPDLDRYVGKLGDVGIPVSHGIFVSASGYTSGAVRRARQGSIRVLELTGLTKNRLESEVRAAFQSAIYLVAEVSSMVSFDVDVPNRGLLYFDSAGRQRSCIPHRFWQLWVTGQVPEGIGAHSILLEPPSGSYQYNEGELRTSTTVPLQYRVAAVAATLRGQATRHGLWNAGSGELERVRVDAKWNPEKDHLLVSTLHTEEAIQKHITSLGDVGVVTRIRAPRIICGRLYWPPSPEALGKVNELLLKGLEPTFADVEGVDIGAAWREFPGGFPLFEDCTDDPKEES